MLNKNGDVLFCVKMHIHNFLFRSADVKDLQKHIKALQKW